MTNYYFSGGLADGARAFIDKPLWIDAAEIVYVGVGGGGALNLTASKTPGPGREKYTFYGHQWLDDGLEYACYTSEFTRIDNTDMLHYSIRNWDQLD